MYLRSTRRRNADGSEVRYYQLAENTWDPERRCAIAKVVYNFGRADQLDAQKLKRLAKSILRVFDGEEQLSALADVTVHDAWPYGGVYVLEQVWRELGIDRLLGERLRSTGIGQPFERALFAMVANRCLAPYSKLYCWEQWISEEVFLPSAASLSHPSRARRWSDRATAVSGEERSLSVEIGCHGKCLRPWLVSATPRSSLAGRGNLICEPAEGGEERAHPFLRDRIRSVYRVADGVAEMGYCLAGWSGSSRVARRNGLAASRC